MTEPTTEKKGVHWGAIFLALVGISAGKFVLAAINGDFDLKKPEVPDRRPWRTERERVAIASLIVNVDVFNDGRIVVNGSQKTLEELRSLIPQWKASKRLISYYHEARTESASPDSDAAAEAFFRAQWPFARRAQPQPRESLKSEAHEESIAAIERLGGTLNSSETTVSFVGTEVTDADLAHLSELTGLRSLDLRGTQVTDPGLAHLTGSIELQNLRLANTQVTGAGLIHLKGLTRMRWLDLHGTKITDEGLVHLKGVTRLSELDLHGTGITDEGLVYLKGMTRLRQLNLEGTGITDEGLVHLEGMTRLRTLLNLGGTGITDAGLAHLEGMTRLEGLNLIGAKVTDAGVEKLQAALPKCQIDS